MDGMKKGLYDSAKWLPIVAERMAQVAKESGTLDKMSNNLDASLARMNNQWAEFTSAMEEAGVADAMARFIGMLTEKLKSLEQFVKDNDKEFVTLIDTITKFGDTLFSKDAAVVAMIASLTALVWWVRTNTFWWGIFNTTINATSIWNAVKALWAMAAASAAAALPIVLITAAVAALVLIFEDLYQWSKGNDSIFGRVFGDTDTVFKNLEDGFKSIREWWDTSVAYLIQGWDKFTAWVGKPFEIGGDWLDNLQKMVGMQPTVAEAKPLLAGPNGMNVNMNNVTIQANDPVTLYKQLDDPKYGKGAK